MYKFQSELSKNVHTYVQEMERHLYGVIYLFPKQKTRQKVSLIRKVVARNDVKTCNLILLLIRLNVCLLSEYNHQKT